ncbi:MAG: DUF2975 domain-containing protein [Deferribacteres bacterium]|nr:DUF2975 domain-containing protein [candidate division KSB1 bacterium]MCB9503616.1 DUF2975 domain-containing protein [Deferribacteres bacterium]
MKGSSTLLLQAVLVLMGIAALAFLLWEPHIEGRNANATLFQVYFNDPFLAYAYVASIPFFVGLYQAFKVLGYIRQNETFSQTTLKALQTIKYCALIIIGFVVVSLIFIYPMFGDKDDRPAGLFLRVLITFASIVVAATAEMFKQILQDAVDRNAEKDLTV